MSAEPSSETSPETPAAKPSGAQAVERALSILTLIAKSETPLAVADICARTGLNRTTAWRLLSTLEDYRFVERGPLSRDYQAGPLFFDIAAGAAAPHVRLARLALPSMRRLNETTRESVVLDVPRFFGSLTVAQLNSPETVRLKDYTHQESSFLGTSTGKVALAHLPEAEVRALVKSIEAWERRAEPVDIEALLAELRLTRERGYGVVFGEFDAQENAVSVPIHAGESRVLRALLCVGGPAFRFTEEKIRAVLPALRNEARAIAAMLG